MRKRYDFIKSFVFFILFFSLRYSFKPKAKSHDDDGDELETKAVAIEQTAERSRGVVGGERVVYFMYAYELNLGVIRIVFILLF